MLVKAARKYKTVFQVGSAAALDGDEPDRVQAGARRAGWASSSWCTASTTPASSPVPDLPEEPKPDKLDWEVWLGQAPPRPYNKKIHFGWMSYLRLFGRRNDQLGRARAGPDPVGAGHGRHRAGGVLAAG